MRIKSSLPKITGTGYAADVGLHRMGQGVQAGLRRDAVEAAPGREPPRHGNKFRCGALAAACHDHGLFAPGIRQQLRQPLQAPGCGDAFLPALGQYPGLQAEAGLKHPTVYFFKQHNRLHPFHGLLRRILGGIARWNGEMDIVGADGSVRPVR